jgi:protein TonB
VKKTALIAVLSLLSPALSAQSGTPAAQATPSPAPALEARPANVKIAGQDVPVPTRKKYVAPEYPAAAAAEGIRGIVIVEVLIGEDGRVESTRVTRSIPGLDEAAMNAVKLWEYEPTKVAGKAVKVQLAQSITFALRLPDLQRAPGIPELKSGGTPLVPPSLATAESAAVAVTIGSQGEVREAAVLEGNAVISEALLRVVKAWRFVVEPGAAPLSFTVRAEWSPGPQPLLTLKATAPKSQPTAANTAVPAPVPPVPTVPAAPAVPVPSPTPSAAKGPEPVPGTAPASPSPAPAPPVETEVIPARPEPPAKEQGASAVADVILGENIPDLVKGRRPVWPPLARLGNVTGDVVVRFSVDLAGKVTVHSAEGPDLLKSTAEQAVGTWLFRRTAIDRLHLIATFKFGTDRSVAKVERAP